MILIIRKKDAVKNITGTSSINKKLKILDTSNQRIMVINASKLKFRSKTVKHAPNWKNI